MLFEPVGERTRAVVEVPLSSFKLYHWKCMREKECLKRKERTSGCALFVHDTVATLPTTNRFLGFYFVRGIAIFISKVESWMEWSQRDSDEPAQR